MEITEKRYNKIRNFFLGKPCRMGILKFVYRAFPAVIAAAYVMLLAYMLFKHETGRFLYSLIIPAAAFFAVSVIRSLFNAERPYEKLNIVPLIQKNKRGASFPSRHCACSFVISTVYLSASPWAGAALFAISVCIAVSRVLAGVHFVRDVSAGALIGILFGLVSFAFACY